MYWHVCLVAFCFKHILAAVDISQFDNVDDLIWNVSDSETSCISFRDDDWSGEVKSIDCSNINLVSGAVISPTEDYPRELNDFNRVFYSDWDGSNWDSIDSEMFWDLTSGSKYSAEPIDISFEVLDRRNYTISIIIQDQDNIYSAGTVYIRNDMIYIYMIFY